MSNEHEKIRITLDDVDHVVVDPPTRSAPPPPPITDIGASRTWGRVDAGPSHSLATGASATANVFLRAWVYLGLAGFLGAFVAWALCEPSFNDRGPRGAGNILLFPAFVILMSLGFALAESVVERFEIVQVHEQQSANLPVAAAQGHGLAQAVNQQAPVGQPC